MTAMSHEEQVEFKTWVRQGLEDVASLEKTRDLVDFDRRNDPALWASLIDMDLLGLAVPDRLGGSGVGGAELGLLLEEAGRCLLPAPYLGTAVIAPLAVRCAGAEDELSSLLADIAAGRVRIGLAVAEPHGTPLPTAAGQWEGWILSGTLPAVVDADGATHLLVVGEVDGSSALFLVDAAAEGVRVQEARALDPSRPALPVILEGVPAVVLGGLDSAPDTVAAVRDLFRLALAADAVGGARRLLELAVEYAKVRHQFGRPIGEFQSLKHRCADLFVACEAAAAAVGAAMAGIDGHGRPRPSAAGVASVYAQEAYWLAVRTAMQIHGGLSLTWELDLHRYLKRATASGLLLGNLDRELARVADLVLDDDFDLVEDLFA